MKDFDRQLVGKGLSEAAIMGKWMVEKGVKPDRFVTSSAARAYKTAEVMGDQMHIDIDKIICNKSLYDGGPRAYLDEVNGTPEKTELLIIFGHNPDITYFGEYLTGADIGSMKKGSMATLEFEDLKWEEISAKTGKLVSYITPKDVKEAHGENG